MPSGLMVVLGTDTRAASLRRKSISPADDDAAGRSRSVPEPARAIVIRSMAASNWVQSSTFPPVRVIVRGGLAVAGQVDPAGRSAA